MCGNGKPVDDTYSHLAQRLFDQVHFIWSMEIVFKNKFLLNLEWISIFNNSKFINYYQELYTLIQKYCLM